jgi:hypothetical protein
MEMECHIEAQCIYWPTFDVQMSIYNHYVNTSVCYSAEAGLGVAAAHARTVAPSGACRADSAVYGTV